MIAEYPIRLGLNPYGHKQREGDFRTPEGHYQLVGRNPRSDYFLSIKVSYPNREDAARRARKRAPARRPDHDPRPAERAAQAAATTTPRSDWTDGCIAVSNADMVDIWLRTRSGIPIEIRP